MNALKLLQELVGEGYKGDWRGGEFMYDIFDTL
jgi:hypothetical protein